MTIQPATSTTVLPGSRWRQNGLGILRIAFGVAWAIDASFKWQPGFVNGVTGYLGGAMEGQPHAIQARIQFWLNVVRVDPYLFAGSVLQHAEESQCAAAGHEPTHGTRFANTILAS